MNRIAHEALALALVLSASVLAREAKPTRSISVSGTVVTQAVPDVVLWRVSLANFDKDMLEAKKANDEKVRAVLALREKLGIAPRDIETGCLSIEREYDRDEHGNQTAFKHFAVRRTVMIRQRDLKRFDEFLDKLVACGDMEIGFDFECTKIHVVRDETRLQALKAAKSKAEAMAKAVGAKLGKVLTIKEESRQDPWANPASNWLILGSSGPKPDVGSSTFAPGAIQVRVTVYATFKLD